jgi:hypothetical protein
MNILTEEQIQIILQAQQEVLDSGEWSVLIGVGGLVNNLIYKTDPQLAGIYWSWFCKFNLNREAPEPLNDERVVALQRQLCEYDKKCNEEYPMPSWGWAGT